MISSQYTKINNISTKYKYLNAKYKFNINSNIALILGDLDMRNFL